MKTLNPHFFTEHRQVAREDCIDFKDILDGGGRNPGLYDSGTIHNDRNIF